MLVMALIAACFSSSTGDGGGDETVRARRGLPHWRYWRQPVVAYENRRTTEAVYVSHAAVRQAGAGLVDTGGLYCLSTEPQEPDGGNGDLFVDDTDPFEVCVVGFRRAPRRVRLPLLMPPKKFVVCSTPSRSTDDPELPLPITHYDDQEPVETSRRGKLLSVPDSCSVMMQRRVAQLAPAAGGDGTAADGAAGREAVETTTRVTTTRAVNVQVYLLAIRDEVAFKRNMELLTGAVGGLSALAGVAPVAAAFVPAVQTALELSQGTFCGFFQLGALVF